jgi:tetrameric-type glycyl-tRNA synthetase beta subunit
LREKQGTRFLFAQIQDKPVFLPSLILRQFEDWIVALPSPLKMRWLPSDISEAFVRPVRWVLALFGSQVVPFLKTAESAESQKQAGDATGRFGISTGNLTSGQRIQSPQPKKITSAAEYFDFLGSIGIERRFAARRANLLEQGQHAVAAIGRPELSILRDDRLLDKCVGLAETPRAYVGRFSKEHLRLPAPLIASVLRDHMNAFAVTDASGALAEYFVGLANYEPVDPAGMIEAAQQVVEGRLADGTFYFDSDLKTPMSELSSKLDRQVFQEGLGSLSDKQNRIATIVKQLCADSLLQQHERVAEQAALHCKLDLQTGCVTEFPDEMQGVMGQYLAQTQGLSGLPAPKQGTPISPELSAAAKGIGEHYLPLSMEGRLPETVIGTLLSFADKLDTVASLFARGDRVKGNKDPFGIRRNTLSVLRLAAAFGDRTALTVTPQQLLNYAFLSVRCHHSKNVESLHEELIEFITARISAAWREHLNAGAAEAVTRMLSRSMKAHRPWEAVQAPRAPAPALLSFGQAYQLAKALDAALTDKESQLGKALASYKRARNIVEKGKEWLAANSIDAKLRQPDSTLFQQPEENELFRRTTHVSASASENMKQGKFDLYLADLATLEGPMESFFESVMVNVPEMPVRANRLLLLSAVLELYENFADFSAF